MHVLLDRVVATSTTEKSRQAQVKAEFSESLNESDGFAVWFNLDRDNVPEVLTHHVAGSLYVETFTMSSWTATTKDISGRCFKARSVGAAASVVRFNPHCSGEPARSMRVRTLRCRQRLSGVSQEANARAGGRFG